MYEGCSARQKEPEDLGGGEGESALEPANPRRAPQRQKKHYIPGRGRGQFKEGGRGGVTCGFERLRVPGVGRARRAPNDNNNAPAQYQ